MPGELLLEIHGNTDVQRVFEVSSLFRLEMAKAVADSAVLIDLGE
jgi:hypothetical protein